MSQVETDVLEYFSSLSCMSKTIVALDNFVQESYGEKWDLLTEDEKETVFDEYLIPQSIADLYKDSNTDNLPAVFPKLKVACGEKIIVEESGRTWVDEHSGPFSWANRSQQDLTLFGTEEEMQEKKPMRPPRRHRSPDNDVGKTLGNSQGKHLGNPQQDMSAADEIFQKFGIQFGQEEEEEEEEVEDSSGPLLPNPDSKAELSYFNSEMLPKSEIDHVTSQMDHVTSQMDHVTSSMDHVTSQMGHVTKISQPMSERDILGKSYPVPSETPKLDLELASKQDLSDTNTRHNGSRYDSNSFSIAKNPSNGDLRSYGDNVGTHDDNVGTHDDNVRSYDENVRSYDDNVQSYDDNVESHDDEVGSYNDTSFSLTASDVKFDVSSQVVDMQPISIPYPEFLAEEEQDKDLIESDAKTGFDFLDNW